MNSLVSLLKYNLLNSFPIINKLNKKKNKSTKGLFALCALIYLLMFIFIVIYMFMFMSIFNEAGRPEIILLMGVTISSIMVFFTNLTQANSYIFRTKDYDLLMSLPIKQKDIVISKLLSLYIYNFIFVFSIMGAIYIPYAVIAGFDIIMFILYVISMFFVPLIPIGISSFIAFGFGYVPLPQKVKNISSTILYIILFIIFTMFYTTILESSESELLNQIGKMADIFKKLYFMSETIFNGFYEKNILSFILFISISVIVVIMFVFIVSKLFKNFNNHTNRSKVKSNYSINKEEYKSNSEVKALFIKELRNYINIPSYIMNTIVGPILSVAATFTLSTQLLEGLQGLLPEDSGISNIPNFAIGFLGVIIIFFISMTSTSSSSISLEGKNFWILKSAPIKTKSVFISKILLNVLILTPFIIADIIIAYFLLECDLVISILVLLMDLLFVISFSVFGLYINILLPKFEFDSPLKVVKQSGAVFVSMIVSFVISFLMIIIYIIFNSMFNPTIGIIAGLVIGLISCILSIVLLCTHGKKKYNNLNV